MFFCNGLDEFILFLRWAMRFLKDFLINLFWLFVIGLILFLVFPDLIGQVYKALGDLFGPLAILMIIVVAIPRKRTKS